MYYALIMLKRISPQDPSNPLVTKPSTIAAGNTAQPEPSEAAPAQLEPDVAIVPPEADPKPLVAIEAKKKKKIKKNQFFCVFSFIFVFFLLGYFRLIVCVMAFISIEQFLIFLFSFSL